MLFAKGFIFTLIVLVLLFIKRIVLYKKAAYLATVLKYKVKKFEKYQGLESIKELVIDQSFDSKLNKLKKGNPEAFYYWYQISLIRTVK